MGLKRTAPPGGNGGKKVGKFLDSSFLLDSTKNSSFGVFCVSVFFCCSFQKEFSSGVVPVCSSVLEKDIASNGLLLTKKKK